MKIAVVDDEASNRKLMKSRMEILRPDAQVSLYGSGDEFLENYPKDRRSELIFNLVFLDNNMPGKTGVEVVEVIRERGYKDPICMNSAIMGEADSDAIAAVQEAFGIDFLPKTPETTMDDYRRILEKYGI